MDIARTRTIAVEVAKGRNSITPAEKAHLQLPETVEASAFTCPFLQLPVHVPCSNTSCDYHITSAALKNCLASRSPHRVVHALVETKEDFNVEYHTGKLKLLVGVLKILLEVNGVYSSFEYYSATERCARCSSDTDLYALEIPSYVHQGLPIWVCSSCYRDSDVIEVIVEVLLGVSLREATAVRHNTVHDLLDRIRQILI